MTGGISDMQLIVQPDGQVRCLYDDLIDLTSLGLVKIRRASHVEPDGYGNWWADLFPCDGPRLGPFPSRRKALRAEVDWLEQAGFPF